MEKINNFIDKWGQRLFSSTYQLQRIIILAGVVLALALASFGGYYYYDRYYRPQQKVEHVTVAKAEQAVRDDPNNTVKRLNLAETYMVNSRFDEALTQVNEVLATEPENQRAWFLLGVSNNLKGNYKDAVEPLQKFLDANKNADMPGLNKTLQSAAYYLGDSYLQLNQPDKAVPVLEMNLQWAETDADTLYKLGMAYSGVKDYNKALKVLYRAVTFVPDYTEAYQQMAVVFDATNEPDLANYARGMVAYSKKDYQGAKELLLKAAQARPDSAPTFVGLGLTYESLGDLKNAKSSYEAALKLDQNDLTASDGLTRVETLLQK